MTRPRTLSLFAAVAAVVATAAACGGSGSSSGDSQSAGSGKPLVGTFRLTPGKCTSGAPTGSYFRMIEPHGTLAHGKFFDNPDSTCKDKSFTVQAPGADGGLETGRYQPSPATPFDATGNSRAHLITKPGTFTAIRFGIETNRVDPQTHHAVPPPRIVDTAGKLSGQVEAWSASWNNQYFNQGSPKPDGSRPGLTLPVRGTYDARTGAFVLTWASQVVGGPFNGFTGYWHLQGHFVAARR
ncbi:MAG TPA: hypothetical protein VG708_12940 [Mycobacteriales bacterium]|jgi:hypothetical protein|nr:hypothetical protein [Mycobacteriales bacterium]